jgi:transposase
VKFEARTKELVETFPDLVGLVEPLLVVRQVLREQLGILRRRLLAIVRNDDVCRRLMTIPGVGPVVALTYRATVDVPIRFRKSKSVGAVFGLTCAKYQSGANRPNRRDIAVRRRDGAMQDRQAARHEKGDRRPGTSPGRDHARIYGPTARC